MPTIIINTNIKPSDKESRGEQDVLEAEVKQELETIVNKLMAESKMLSSFTIKYDLDDSKSSGSSACICSNFVRLFSNMVNYQSTNQMDKVLEELALIRQSQCEMKNQIGLISNRLDQNLLPKFVTPETSVLAGAKKRKLQNSDLDYYDDTSDLHGFDCDEFDSSEAQCDFEEDFEDDFVEENRNEIIKTSSTSSSSISTSTSSHSDQFIHYPNREFNEGLVNKRKSSTPPVNRFSNGPTQIQPGVETRTNEARGRQVDLDANQVVDSNLVDLCLRSNIPKHLKLDSYTNFRSPIVYQDDAYYVEESVARASYAKSKSRRNFSAHLTKAVFTPIERLESNCNGRFGKKALDPVRLGAIRNTIFKYYPIMAVDDPDETNVWNKDCIPAIDETNRVLKKQLLAKLKRGKVEKELY